MDFKTLNRDNFMLYAIGKYTNPQCIGMNEFNEDLNRIKYVKRLLKKYMRSGRIRPILLLNHLTILGNVFTPLGASRMLFYKLEPSLYPPLKTALLYLNYIGEGMVLEAIRLDSIPVDGRLAEALRRL
jgi:hypothetical protein